MTTRIQQRGEGRQAARSILDLVDLPTPNHIDAFIDEIETKLRPEKKVEEHEKQKRRLSELLRWQMPFGAHSDKTLDEIPRDYLHWLSSSTEETKAVIDEYLEATKTADNDE